MADNFIKKFNSDIRKILISAEQIAKESNSLLNTEHLLLALVLSKNNLASDVLQAFEISPDRVSLIISLIDKQALDNNSIVADHVKNTIQIAVQTASLYKHPSISPEHLLYGLVSNKSFNSYLVIERIGVDPSKIKTRLKREFEASKNNVSVPKNDFGPVGPMINPFGPSGIGEEMFDENMSNIPFLNQGQQAKKESALDSYAVNLTRLSKENKLDPVIGRKIEIERIIQTLSRRTKNNPILIGEPGVGKTSIVEGLAQRIVKNDVPPRIAASEIYSLDLGSILAGTMYRGQFESRIKKLLEEVKKKGNIILFVDEIHMLVGAGSTEGSIDAANLLKPMLARGELRLIGSTTFDEYKKYIEKDAAFERRFQQIKVMEPNVAETISILQGVKKRYESHHRVKYTDESLVAAAELSKRYINDRFLPDKAIDLIDEAGAAKNSKERPSKKVDTLKQQLRNVLKQKDTLLIQEKFEQASKLKEEEVKIEIQIENILKAESVTKHDHIITDIEIAKLVSDWTGIPVSSLSAPEKKRYLNIDKALKKYIIGQDQAVLELGKAIRRSRVGISNPKRPIGSFMFLGPTGVGKSELAKVLSKELLGDENSLIKIDMSEFMERHNVSRLVGAPAGYIGYEEGGKLTEIVRKNPYAVILLDEIEKAHPEVFNILLQIMEDGSLTDAKGRRVDFKNTILIMTSNLGTDIINRQSRIGFSGKSSKENYDHLSENVKEAVEKNFKPEFLNRLDKLIVFYPLGPESIKKIAKLQLEELASRLAINGYRLDYTPKITAKIAEQGFDEKFGARPIRKYIADEIETQISDAILKDQYLPGNKITLDLVQDRITLK